MKGLSTSPQAYTAPAFAQPCACPHQLQPSSLQRTNWVCGTRAQHGGRQSARRPARSRRTGVRRAPEACDKSGKPSDDIIERTFKFFFGEKEKEPFGLKRFDRDRFPELYVATLDEFADPVESDTEEMKLFRPLLARTQLQSRELQLLYDADVHGWSAEAFHGCVDRKGACVGIAATEGAVFGYYNPKGHVGYGESRGSIAAFLFTWQDGDTSKSPVKLRKVGRGALACIDDPDSGPKLGADSFVVPLRPPRATWDDLPEDRVARSKLGSYFERLPTGNNRSSLFAEGENLKGEMLRYLRVYAGVYGEDEEIPFNDALPFSLE